MEETLIMTPGPTAVAENVRLARAKVTTNPDIDLEFYDFYKATCEKFAHFLHTKNDVRILAGEGILGLEAACASLTEPGDKVLVLDNGVYGAGFADFVKMYGGEPIILSSPKTEAFDIQILANFLQTQSDFKYATLVHCDTPSGVLNEIEGLCQLLKSQGILTVVDSVSAMGGEQLEVDNWGIDIVLGASQKVLSAPPGLTFLSISSAAYQAMEKRRQPIASFYANLLVFKDYFEKKWFPYTMPISDIMGLAQALDNLLADEATLERHRILAQETRKVLRDAGLELYLDSGFSNTVTVLKVPKSLEAQEILAHMLERYQVMITGSFDFLEGKVLRIGHMGENAQAKKITKTLEALQKTLEFYGFELKINMKEAFEGALTLAQMAF